MRQKHKPQGMSPAARYVSYLRLSLGLVLSTNHITCISGAKYLKSLYGTTGFQVIQLRGESNSLYPASREGAKQTFVSKYFVVVALATAASAGSSDRCAITARAV